MAALVEKLKSPFLLWSALLLLALWLRWPLPEPGWQHVDEWVYVVHPLGFWGGDLNPHFLIYPTFHLYLLSAFYYLYFLLCSRESLEAFVAYRYFVNDQDLVVLARGFDTLMAVGTVAVTVRLGRRLYGEKGGWLAGWGLALMPLHLRFSHLASTDAPATLWISLALLWALRLVQEEGQLTDAVFAGLFAGLAGATKYPACLVLVPVLAAAWWSGPKRLRNAGTAAAAALVAAALATPYVWLDWQQCLADLASSAREHMVEGVHRTADSAWLHLLRHTLWYGLGLAGMVSLALALVWRPRTWSRAEGVLLVGMGAFLILLVSAQSVFMRYALPLTPMIAVLIARPLLGLKPRRLILAGWLAALLFEPIWASLQIRALLSGGDTRMQLRQWLLEQRPQGARILPSSEIAGNLGLLTPAFLYVRQKRFSDRFDLERLIRAYELLSQRPDLPPLYLSWNPATAEEYLATQPDQAAGSALVLSYVHPLCPPNKPLAALDRAGRVEWLESFSPGDPSAAVFDPVDWNFLPVAGWSTQQQTGPDIHLGKMALRVGSPLPTSRDFFALLHHLMAGSLAVAAEDWPKVLGYYEPIMNMPYFLPEVLPDFYVCDVYLGAGRAYHGLGRHQQALDCWKEAARLEPDKGEIHHLMGLAYSALGQDGPAVQAYLRAIDLQVIDPGIYYNLGMSYVKLQRLPEAIAAFQTCVAHKPDADAYVNLGVLYSNAGQREQARSCFSKALQLAPNHPQAAAMREELQAKP